jgi:hypothetical protein
MTFEVCQDSVMLLPVSNIIPDIFQTSLHKHGTIAQITPEIPQTSLHKHGTITQNTADTPQSSCNEV